MTNANNGSPPHGNQNDDGGWGDFASDHTTVDPNLLARLQEIDDEPPPSSAPAGPVPEPTVTLDVDELLNLPGLDKPPATPATPPSVPPTPAANTIEFADDFGGQVSEGVGEKTQVFVPTMEDEPTRAKLRVLQGGGNQKEYMLARDRITMGRGTNNDILIPDIAISRQHLEIARQGDGTFLLRDLNSGNGVKVNGTRILEAALFGGDRIEIGSTIFEFVLTGGGAPAPTSERYIKVHPDAGNTTTSAPSPSGAYPAPAVPNYSQGPGATMTHQQMVDQAPGGGSNAVAIALVCCFALVFLAVGGIVIYKVMGDSDSAQTNTKALASEFYSEGISQAKSKQWDLAEESFQYALEAAQTENNPQIRKDAKLQLELVQREQQNEITLRKGRKYARDNRFTDAIAKLETIRSSSVYYEDARKIVDSSKEKYADQLVREAREDFTEKRYDKADRKVSIALATLPSHKGADELRAEILALPSDTFTPVAVQNVPRNPKPPKRVANNTPKANTKPKTNNGGNGGNGGNTPKTNNGANAGNGGNNTPRTPKTPTGSSDLSRGMALYKSSKFTEAAQFFDSVASREEGMAGKKASTLARSVRAFEQSYKNGTTAFNSGDVNRAITLLTSAVRLDRAIASGFQAPLRKMLTDAHYKQAKSAFDAQNFARAGVHAKKSKSFTPGHGPTLSLLADLEAKAKSMYIDAINKRDADPRQARRIAQSIVSMLPAGSDTHKKAKKLLAEL